MKGMTNATRGSADVVQDSSKIQVLDTTLQTATDAQAGIMSAADHATLSTTATRIADSFVDVSLSEGKMTFTKANGSTKEVDISGSDVISTDLLVNVLDSEGSPVSGATITVDLATNDWDLSNFTISATEV